MSWKCNTCGVNVEEVDDIKMYFNDMDLPEAEGYRCPACGKEWIDPDYAVNDLASAEEMLAGK
jgi:hypothetical protein